MSTLEPEYKYLRDIFTSNAKDTELIHIEGNSSQMKMIRKFLYFDKLITNYEEEDRNADANLPDMLDDLSHVTLDIRNVIITEAFERMLYKWMEHYNLNVVDTSVDPNMKTLTIDPETGQLVEGPKKITFRNEAFLEKKRQLNLRRSFDITQFYEELPNGKKEFTKESARSIVSLIAKRQGEGEMRKLPLSVKRVSTKDEESIKEISAFLISAINHTEVHDHVSEIGRYHILPTVSQLCFDFSTGEKAWVDIKKKFPVGSDIYFSKTETSYIKARVVENALYNEAGESLLDKERLEEEDRKLFYNILLEYDNQFSDTTPIEDEDETSHANTSEDEESAESSEEVVADDDSDADKEEKQYFVLKRSYVLNRSVLVFPATIFEGGEKSHGFPTNEEMKHNKQFSKIKDRIRLEFNQNASLYFGDDTSGDANQDLIAKYRKDTRRISKEKGTELPELDLKDIIAGNDSPFKSFRY